MYAVFKVIKVTLSFSLAKRIMFGLLLSSYSLFSHAIEIKGSPVFDLTFTDIATGEKSAFYSNPKKVFIIPKVVVESSEQVDAIEALEKKKFLANRVMAASTAASKSDLKALVYINGMNTTNLEAEANLKVINEKVTPRVGVDRVELAWNQKEGLVEELAEVATQHIKQDYNLSEKQSWRQFAYRFMSPGKFALQKFAKEAVAKLDGNNYVDDVDLRYSLDKYFDPLLKQGYKVVMLSHSQGNFYANRVWGTILQGKNGAKLSKSIGVVGVATPATYVADNGLYSTNKNDLVINSIRRYSEPHLQPMPANVEHDIISGGLAGDLAGHSLTDIYLGDTYQGHTITNKIVQDINTTFDRLEVAGTCAPFYRSSGGNWTGTYHPGANFNGKLEFVIDAHTARNSIKITNKFNTPVFYSTGFFSGKSWGKIDYSDDSMGTLNIFIGAEDSGDVWDFRINCIP